MAYYTLHAYDADVWVREFRGLNQADESLNNDPMYASEEWNVETPGGVLQPQAAMRMLADHEDWETNRVETLAVLHRRWYQGAGSNEWYIACAGGKFYQKQKGAGTWMPITLPSGITAYQSSAWSWVTYEIPDESDPTKTIDVLLMSNAVDGMIMVIPPERPRTWGDVKTMTWGDVKTMTWGELLSPVWQIHAIDTEGYKFGVIERYAERIWGSALLDDPDALVYSRPYDPTDWTAAGADEQPEDGAGIIHQPSWDGDRFYALLAFGDQLIAFKRNRVWRIMGTNPGEFNLQEQFGGGTSCYATIAKDAERVYMAGVDGLSTYDGMTVSPWWRAQIARVWRMVNLNAIDQICGVMYKHRYYLSIPTGTSAVNNAVMVCNLEEGTVLFYKGMQIEAFLPTNDALFATSSSLPGSILEIRYDSWVDGAADGKATKWMSPWMDFGYKRIVKGGFDLYFTPEVQEEAVTLIFRIETEKKTKTKQYTVEPSEKEHRNKRLHFSGAGRRFRLIIETEDGVTAPWRLIGGIQLVVETDAD